MGSRSKDATVVLVDAGPTMRTALRERAAVPSQLQFKSDAQNERQLTTRFDAAIAAVESVIQQKLFFKPKDEVGVVLFGTEGTDNQLNEDQGDYEHVTVLSSIDTPTLSVCEKLRTLTPTSDDAVHSDLLDGLIVALDLLHRRTDGKKYDKKLLVITDAACKIADLSDIEPVVTMVQGMDVKLQIVGIDFKHTTDKEAPVDPVKDEPVAPSEDVQIKTENEKMLVSIAKEVQGDVSSASKRMHLLAQGMKKTVGQTTKFRGPLEIGPDFGIPLYCYLKTKTATLPTLMKESQVSHDKETSGKVRMDRRYTTPQNPDEEVAPDDQIKAYRYGMERVPFSSADVDSFKFQTEKSLKLLGFVDKSQLSWSKFIGGTDVFVAEPGKPNAAHALAALIEGMLDMDHVAVARFVARKNAAPKIIALIPHRPSLTERYYALWGQQLPYEEDLRAYEFAPLKIKKHAPTEAQQALADRLVESLSVKEDKADEVGTCFNPVIRRFFHAVEQRAMDENAPIPPIPSYLESSLTMDEVRRHRIEDIIQGFGDAFQLKEAVKKQSERKKKAFWSDVATTDVKMEGDGDAENDDGAGGGGDADDGGSEIDLDELLDGGDVTSVGSMNPIADFETLVEMGKTNRQRLRTAVEGMQTQITKFFEGGSAAFFPKAVQCLAHFRKRSVEIHYASEFNDFMTELKTKIGGDGESPAWKALQNEGLTLLTSQDDPTLSTTTAQARTFLFGEEMEIDAQAASASLSSQIEAIENEDDMFADFE